MFVYRVGGCFSASPWRKSTSPCNNGRKVKLCTHIGGGNNVSVTSVFRCVDFRKWFQPRDQKDPKLTRKEIALNLDQWVRMRKLVEAINNDHPVLATAQPCYMQDGHLATFECRECYPFLKLGRKSSNPFIVEPYRDSNVVPDACRSFYMTLPRSSYPSESGTPTSTPVVNVCPGARCSTTTAPRASFAVIRTLTLIKLSSISNSRTIVTLTGVCVCVCVCVCIYSMYVE